MSEEKCIHETKHEDGKVWGDRKELSVPESLQRKSNQTEATANLNHFKRETTKDLRSQIQNCRYNLPSS